MKDKINGIKKSVGDFKEKADRAREHASKAVGTMKGAVKVGVITGKAALGKAGQVVNKEAIGQGLEAASKGVGVVAKGARLASKAVGTVADSMQKGSDSMRKFGGNIKGEKDKKKD